MNAATRFAAVYGFADLQTPVNGPYLADQALHTGCLWLAALVIAGRGVSR